jgi:hypothetical protein
MSNLFLHNHAIDVNDFDEFIEGISEIIAIDKLEGHLYWKNELVYNIPIYEQLCTTFGQVEQIINIFLAQMPSTENIIDTEEKADQFCQSQFNAFLGIHFSGIQVREIKQVHNDESYQKWRFEFLSNFDKLKETLGKCIFEESFIKDFNKTAVGVQESIIQEFDKAKRRNLITPFYPDTKIIKDVTQKNFNCKVMELRVYQPVALRVYFSELNGIVYISSIEQKSNADQNSDITKAYTNLKLLMKLK